MSVVESGKKDARYACVAVFEYLFKNPESFVDEIAKSTGYNNATVDVAIHNVLNPIINEKVGFKGEGKEKRRGHLYSLEPTKLADITVLADVLMHLDPQYIPEGLKKSLEEYVTPIIKEQRRKWIKERITEELKELEEVTEEEITHLKEEEARLKRVLEKS